MERHDEVVVVHSDAWDLRKPSTRTAVSTGRLQGVDVRRKIGD